MSDIEVFSASDNLTNHFLIAMPTLQDSIFFHALIYICEHSLEQGAVGILVNSPLNIKLEDVLRQMKMEKSSSAKINEMPILFGGPVDQARGFILHKPAQKWRSTLDISSDVAITTSNDILKAIAEERGPAEVLIALGYAGWGPNQLEQEIAHNLWFTCPANPQILFEMPFEQRWNGVQSWMGIDLNRISGQVGHA